KHKQRLRMEQWLLLALRCLIMLLIGLALADPIRQAAAAGGFGLQGRGRMVVLVIDDSLSSQVEVAATASNTAGSAADSAAVRVRFDELKARAVQLLSTLKPEDRVSLWLASAPVRPIIATATL